VLTGELGSPYKAAIETAPPLAGPLYCASRERWASLPTWSVVAAVSGGLAVWQV